ncbi:MAG: hypothetical protein COB62_02465 [Piscirickettsiaceae bacterium]|nr:MAG: hypothetical protein COB62_02465 [Piscirickettsiaceae bacterium]
MKILLLLSMFLYTTTALAGDAWELAKDENGIKVYTRTNTETQLKDFKADITVQAPIELVRQYMLSLEEHTKWMHERKSSKVIKKLDDKTTIVYSITNAPWPVTDRDAVVSFTVSDGNTAELMRFDVENVEGYVPANEGMVRVPYIKGYWELIKVTAGSTKIVFMNAASPGGSLPDWLADSFVLDMPYNSLNNFRTLVEAKEK